TSTRYSRPLRASLQSQCCPNLCFNVYPSRPDDVCGRYFNSLLGVSPREFLRRARLERARSLLAQTDLSIEKIARQAGFVGRNCMANLFRRHLATTPTEYRAGVRSTTGGLFNCPTQAGAVETTHVQLKSEV
ncbi:helix-turn-helix domain-containing protein, partial [Paraburkholderia sp. BR14263]|uniref:helix-turn-helix domain-containing protein n=1 Tax=unclassified Paraburkholderia TaxID=2615204 RepID=UPI0034CF4717